MRPKKAFDCVEMKNAIQGKHRSEYNGLTDDEVRRRIAERLANSNDVVARKWRRIARVQRGPSLPE